MYKIYIQIFIKIYSIISKIYYGIENFEISINKNDDYITTLNKFKETIINTCTKSGNEKEIKSTLKYLTKINVY